MPPEEFRRLGHETVDWIASYLTEVGDLLVLPPLTPGELMGVLPEAPPETGESMERVLHDFRDSVLPAVIRWNHPAFFAYFAVAGSGPGILGEMLCAALNMNFMAGERRGVPLAHGARGSGGNPVGIGNLKTEEAHVKRAWELLRRAAAELEAAARV